VVEPGRFFVDGFFFARIPASISSAPMGTASVTLAFLWRSPGTGDRRHP